MPEEEKERACDYAYMILPEMNKNMVVVDINYYKVFFRRNGKKELKRVKKELKRRNWNKLNNQGCCRSLSRVNGIQLYSRFLARTTTFNLWSTEIKASKSPEKSSPLRRWI
ncbi:hypothetical protein TorRG33x02_289330 [Trema orientale]|uniref:Uncharacterized protein n=1 Tax=Trema orientale TaxID=63057 RepID=A0A2P5CD78_TREOI|nr:hypothetical protein TorRG33x02_289330 [Trema orientale]